MIDIAGKKIASQVFGDISGLMTPSVYRENVYSRKTLYTFTCKYYTARFIIAFCWNNKLSINKTMVIVIMVIIATYVMFIYAMIVMMF